MFSARSAEYCVAWFPPQRGANVLGCSRAARGKKKPRAARSNNNWVSARSAEHFFFGFSARSAEQTKSNCPRAARSIFVVFQIARALSGANMFKIAARSAEQHTRFSARSAEHFF
jgi:hypothetical protein